MHNLFSPHALLLLMPTISALNTKPPIPPIHHAIEPNTNAAHLTARSDPDIVVGSSTFPLYRSGRYLLNAPPPPHRRDTNVRLARVRSSKFVRSLFPLFFFLALFLVRGRWTGGEN